MKESIKYSSIEQFRNITKEGLERLISLPKNGQI